jgi:hypothetical protein
MARFSAGTSLKTAESHVIDTVGRPTRVAPRPSTDNKNGMDKTKALGLKGVQTELRWAVLITWLSVARSAGPVLRRDM